MPLRAVEWGCGEWWGEDPCVCKPAREGGEKPSGRQCATGRGNRPVWVRACRWSSSLRVNLFPQKNQLQTKGRSPVCRRTWARSKDVFRKVLPQSGIWHTCFFLPCSPDLGMASGRVGKGNVVRKEEKMGAGWDGERMWGQVSRGGEEARWCGVATLPPRSVSQEGLREQAQARLPSWLPLPLVPILAVGTCAGHAAPLLPGLGLSRQGLLHLQLDLGGAQPADGQVVPRNVLHRQLLLPCGGGRAWLG